VTNPTPRPVSPRDRYDGTPATLWEVKIATTAMGCRITQRFQHLPRGLSGIRNQADENPAVAALIVEERTKELTDGMVRTLRQMKRLLESTQSS